MHGGDLLLAKEPPLSCRCVVPGAVELSISILRVGGPPAAVQQAEDGGNEEQRRDGRPQSSPADDRAAERRVLLAPFAEAEGHPGSCRSSWPGPS